MKSYPSDVMPSVVVVLALVLVVVAVLLLEAEVLVLAGRQSPLTVSSDTYRRIGSVIVGVIVGVIISFFLVLFESSFALLKKKIKLLQTTLFVCVLSVLFLFVVSDGSFGNCEEIDER